MTVKMTAFFIILVSVLAFVSLAKTDNTVETGFVKIFNSLHNLPEPQAIAAANVETLWIEQKLDHFDESETKTWDMRYMANDEFYQIGGPLFIYVGGENYISEAVISKGHFYDMAKEHNGYLFHTEHRFYGHSRPVATMINDNMKYLNVRQALADLAHFIRTMKTTITGMENSKVILVGGSYSASMIIWFKKLYPELATGCWASSAPVFAKMNFYEYKEVMGQSITQVSGQACYNRIQNGIAELESMFANKRGAEVKAMLKLCNAFNEYNDLDLWTLFYQISEIFASLVQRHVDGDIQRACSRIMAGSSDVIGIANYIVDNFEYNDCIDMSYRNYLNLIMYTEFYTTYMMRQWTYQTCNEFAWFQTSASKNQPFGSKHPLDYFIVMCADAFGSKFTKEFIQQQVDATNEFFGGLTPQVENVYMTHGQLDPWHPMGILDSNQSTIIPNYAHCKDLKSISDNDTAELKASKERIADLVRQWLSE